MLLYDENNFDRVLGEVFNDVGHQLEYPTFVLLGCSL